MVQNCFFFSVKKVHKQYFHSKLLWHHAKITYKNIVQKDKFQLFKKFKSPKKNILLKSFPSNLHYWCHTITQSLYFDRKLPSIRLFHHFRDVIEVLLWGFETHCNIWVSESSPVIFDWWTVLGKDFGYIPTESSWKGDLIIA